MDMLKITGYHNRAFPKKGAIRGAVSRRLAWMQHHKVFVLFFFGYLAAFCCGTFFHEEGESFSPLLQTNFLSRMQQPFWMGFLSLGDWLLPLWTIPVGMAVFAVDALFPRLRRRRSGGKHGDLLWFGRGFRFSSDFSSWYGGRGIRLSSGNSGEYILLFLVLSES